MRQGHHAYPIGRYGRVTAVVVQLRTRQFRPDPRVLLPCAVCHSPWGYVQGGALVVESRHHGERHRNVLTLERVRELLLQSK